MPEDGTREAPVTAQPTFAGEGHTLASIDAAPGTPTSWPRRMDHKQDGGGEGGGGGGEVSAERAAVRERMLQAAIARQRRAEESTKRN